MKRILFPVTNRVHLARQKLLLEELRKEFEVDVIEYQDPKHDMVDIASSQTIFFKEVIDKGNYDLVIVRGDRFEMLPIAMVASYRGIKLAHIEGGDLSGAIDNKVRYAITALADIHFSTNKESFARLIRNGTDPDWTFNFGSLDVEYAKSVCVEQKQDMVLMCYHPMPNEEPAKVEEAIQNAYKGRIIVIKSNSDNGQAYGLEEYPPDVYIDLLAGAKCLVGNSSSFLKEASIFGTPVVNIGDRQKNRLKAENVLDVPYDLQKIEKAIAEQLRAEYKPSEIYYKPDTSKRICQKIKQFLD